MGKPLEGIRVLELANYVAAPIVGRMMADLGASVIKVEGRGGDAWRTTASSHTQTGWDENPLFDLFNAGKRSLSLNLKTEKGMEIFFRLLEGSDVFLTNTRQQSLVKLGIDYDTLKDRFPRLIYATLTGYGYEGPDRNAPGFDNIAFWSRPGFSVDMSFNEPGNYPVNSRYAMGDTITGTNLFGGVMTALFQRERTGKGDFVTMSLYNAGIWAFCGSIVMAEKPYEHPFPDKRNMGIPMNLAFRCADGEWVRCTILEFDRYAYKFFDALGVRAEMEALNVTSLHRSEEEADKIVPLYEKVFLQKTSQEWLDLFESMDIVCGRMAHFKDVLTDEQAWANDYLQPFTCANGAERVLPTCPVRLGSQGPMPIGEPLPYGGHNEEILAELGYGPAEIAAMTQEGIFR